jgi:hypothetical protein
VPSHCNDLIEINVQLSAAKEKIAHRSQSNRVIAERCVVAGVEKPVPCAEPEQLSVADGDLRALPKEFVKVDRQPEGPGHEGAMQIELKFADPNQGLFADRILGGAEE